MSNVSHIPARSSRDATTVELPWDMTTPDENAAPVVSQHVPVRSENASEEVAEIDDVVMPERAPKPVGSVGGWTIAVLCVGLAIIACCVIVPQADANRRMMYERQKLQLDLDQVKSQIAVNKDFLQRVSTDATLAERLAQRQMKMIPRGTTVLQLRDQPTQFDMSPFLLVNLPAPAPMPAYKPVGGLVSDICLDPKKRLYLLGCGLFLVAAGLVMGGASRRATVGA